MNEAVLVYILGLVMYFQPPGFVVNDFPYTYSKKIEQQPGFAVAIFLLILRIAFRVGKLVKLRFLYCYLLWLFSVGYLGLFFYPTSQQNAHLFYSVTSLLSSYVLSCLLYYESLFDLYQISRLSFWFLFLVLVFFVYDNLTGVAEITYLYFAVRSWSVVGSCETSLWKTFFLA